MIYVNATIYYRGTKPTKEYIHQLQTDFEYRFVTLETKEIAETTFSYKSDYISRIICPGNPDLSLDDRIQCSSIATDFTVQFKWDNSLWPGIHTIYCPKGDYQVLTYTPSSWLDWFLNKFKFFKS